MYAVDFYQTSSGHCDVLDFLEELRQNSHKSKDARIQYTQAARDIQLLQDNGFNLPVDILKHIENDIWELRPGCNRIFLFYYVEGSFILLHHYKKQTQKTPRREIDRAIIEMNDYISRKEQANELG